MSRKLTLWRGVVSLAVAEMTSWGILYYSFAVFLGFLVRDLDVSTAAVSGAFSVALVASAVAAGPVGRALDRWGARRVMTTGGLLAIAAFSLFHRADRLWHVYVLWGLIGLSHAGVLYEPAFAAVARWFPELAGRTRALLVVTSVAGLASTVFLPLTAFLSERYGWRDAALVLAVALAVVTLPLHAWLPREDLAPGASRAPATRRAGLHFLGSIVAIQAFVSAGVAVHLVTYLHATGLSLSAAAGIAGLSGAAQVPGRLLFGPFMRWAGQRWRLPILLTAQGVALLAIVALRDVAVIGAVVLFGAANGMLTLERATLVAERFGVAEYGAISGRIATFSLIGRAAAPFAVAILAGAISHGGGFAMLSGMLVAAAAMATRGRGG